VFLRVVVFLPLVLVDLAAEMFLAAKQPQKLKNRAPKPSAGHTVQTGDGALNR